MYSIKKGKKSNKLVTNGTTLTTIYIQYTSLILEIILFCLQHLGFYTLDRDWKNTLQDKRGMILM